MLRFVCRAHMATWFIAALRGANLRYSNWIFCIQQLSYWDSPKDTKLTSVRRRLICQLHAPSLTFDCFETRYELSRRRWVSIRRGGFMTDVHEVSICLKSFFFRSMDTHLEAFSIFNQNFLRLIVETSYFSLRRKTPQEEVTFWTRDIQVHHSREEITEPKTFLKFRVPFDYSKNLVSDSEAMNCETSHSYIVIGRNRTSTRDHCWSRKHREPLTRLCRKKTENQ